MIVGVFGVLLLVALIKGCAFLVSHARAQAAEYALVKEMLAEVSAAIGSDDADQALQWTALDDRQLQRYLSGIGS